MNRCALNFIRIALLLVFLAAAAATPTLAEAKPASKSAAKTSRKASARKTTTKVTKKKTVKTTVKKSKKMVITFDGSSSVSSADEALRPQASNRDLDLPGETVHLRGGSMDDFLTPSAAPIAKAPAATVAKRKVVIQAAPQPAAPAPVVIARATPRPRVQLEYATVKPTAAKLIAKTDAKPIPREAPSRAQIVSSTSVRTAAPSSYKYSFVLENTVTMGRTFELEEEGGRNFAMKNEVFLGMTGEAGWGLTLTASFNSTSNADASRDLREFGDPSIMVSHPSFFKSDTVDIYGRARYYAPVSASSSAASLHHFAYYLLTDITLPAQVTLSNALIPRYFVQSEYAETDAYALLFDSTELTKQLGANFRIGVGQQTQIESHQATANGVSVEAYPFLDFTGISNTLLQAKMYVPLYVNGAVGGAPVAAGISNLQAEFFAKISF